MFVFVPPPKYKSSNNLKSFERLPDSINKEVQELLDTEIKERESYNNGLWAKIFGKKSIDREDVLNELKRMNPFDDDRYFLATMCNEKIK